MSNPELLQQHRVAQALQLPAGDLRPLSGVVQFQVGLPMVDCLQGIALPFAQERQVEVRVGVMRIQREGAAVEVEGFRVPSLFVVEVAQIERASCRERV